MQLTAQTYTKRKKTKEQEKKRRGWIGGLVGWLVGWICRYIKLATALDVDGRHSLLLLWLWLLLLVAETRARMRGRRRRRRRRGDRGLGDDRVSLGLVGVGVHLLLD